LKLPLIRHICLDTQYYTRAKRLRYGQKETARTYVRVAILLGSTRRRGANQPARCRAGLKPEPIFVATCPARPVRSELFQAGGAGPECTAANTTKQKQDPVQRFALVTSIPEKWAKKCPNASEKALTYTNHRIAIRRITRTRC